MPKCKQCDHVAENQRTMRQHYKAAGHPTTSRKKRDAPDYAVGALLSFDPQDEGALISAVTRAFERMALPDDGVRRVIAYITDRYAPNKSMVQGITPSYWPSTAAMPLDNGL